jgi:hypothetical protein
LDTEKLRATTKNQISQSAKNLSDPDIRFLVETLAEKDDVLRYKAFLLLQASSQKLPIIYQYWDILVKKLDNENSYQRSVGLMLVAENVRWDKEGKFAKTIDKYLSCCSDEKFITARQAIQGLANIVDATNQYNDAIKQKLSSLSLAQYKENQQKLLNKDIANIQKIIERKSKPK